VAILLASQDDTRRPTRAPVYPGPAPAPDVEIGAARRDSTWFAVVPTAVGPRLLCSRMDFLDRFRRAILAGVLRSTATVEVHSKRRNGEWQVTRSPLGDFASRYFTLHVLYRPVWSHATAGFRWGAAAGIVLILAWPTPPGTGIVLGIARGMVTGSLLGCLPGMGIAGLIGLLRRRGLKRAPDAPVEGPGVALAAVALPLAAGAILLALYL
jgi:hypothetical protein